MGSLGTLAKYFRSTSKITMAKWQPHYTSTNGQSMTEGKCVVFACTKVVVDCIRPAALTLGVLAVECTVWFSIMDYPVF